MRDTVGEPQHWMIDRYGEEGLRHTRWFRDGVQRFHRMTSTLLNGLTDAGLIIERVIEPMPTDDQLRAHPEWIQKRRRPIFFLVRAMKVP